MSKTFDHGGGATPARIYLQESKLTAVQRQITRGGLNSYEPDVQAAFYGMCELLGNNIKLFDVGAHIGLFSCMTSAIFSKNNPYIMAFEPSQTTFETAVKIRDRNNFKYNILKKAVSNTSGEVKFYLSSVSEASNSLNANFRENSVETSVPVTTIDEVVDSGACAPTIIKIDVETFEYAVILGGIRVISRSRPEIFCELLTKSDKTLTQMALSSLESIGYKFYQIKPEGRWETRTAAQAIDDISGSHRDWLLTTRTLTDEFYEKFSAWQDAMNMMDQTKNIIVARGEKVPDLG